MRRFGSAHFYIILINYDNYKYGLKENIHMKKRPISLSQFHDQAVGVRSQFLQALPVIVIFLAMFYSVIFLFGMQYTMVVSLATLIFQVNYKKQHTVGSILLVILHHLFLFSLAYAATWNLAFCIVLNLTVPFWLIFTKASQFNQLGYFSGLMTFTFMQMMPVDFYGFLVQLCAMMFCCLIVFVTVLIYSEIRLKKADSGTEGKVMILLGNILEETLEKKEIKEDLNRLFELQRTLYREAYQEQGRRHVVTSVGKIKYMFAIMIQRTAYLVSVESSLLTPSGEEERRFAFKIAAFMKEAGKADLLEDNGEIHLSSLRRRGRYLLYESEKGRSDFYKAMTNFLRMYLFIIYQAQQKDSGILDKHWEMPAEHRLKEKLFSRFRPDTFEMRFALRMSVVLIVGMTMNMLFDEGHSYWFVMNAFLLLRPMYEDSNYRMRTRFMGTAAGCLIVAAILPFFTGITLHLIIAGIFVICMYTATPGTIVHAVFVTCFALTMTTLAMGESTAAFLRLAYVVAAVVFVLLVNRFFFPTSFGSQFRYNFQMLFHMHHMYLRMLENALTESLDYWRICDAQIQYHMVHSQIREDIPKTINDEEREYYYRLLSITWRMASEIQQMFFHVKHKRRGPEARKIMESYIIYTDYVLNQIQETLHLKKEKKMKKIGSLKYQRYIEGEKELSELMTQYARNLSRLYVLVLRHYRKPTEPVSAAGSDVP